MFAGYKTYIVAAMTVLGAIVSYLIGDSTLQAAVSVAIPAILAVTIRHGIANAA